MKVRIESPQFTADHKLIDYLEKKINKLDHYYDRILDADIILKLENSGQIKDKVLEVKLHVPGETLFIKEVDKSFEAAMDIAADRLKRKLIRYKELQRSHR
jgi:putative sigma-54 modulation protein